MIEIRMHGRGGQGTVVASKALGIAFFLEGRYIQSYPQYGVERRGAPVQAFLRVAEPGEEEFVRSQIYEPDQIIILDPTLLDQINVLEGLKPGGWVIINSPEAPENIDIPEIYNVATVDASSIAIKHRLGTKAQPIVNTAILGGYAGATKLVSIENVKEAIKQTVPIKPEENARAAEEAYYSVRIRKASEVKI